jgi:DNA repair protein RadC
MSMKICEMPLESRPRERMQKLGAQMLSDAELLAIVLQKGTKGENVIDVSHRLLSLYGAKHLSKLSLKELQKINGIGPAKAMQISALFEFAKRHSASMRNGKPLHSAKDVFHYVAPKLQHADKEMFMVLHLDAKNKVVKEEIVSIGILDASLIHPREVFKSAIKESSRAVIFVHNHPSGDPTPSAEDEAITNILKEAGELLDIPVLDHVIVGTEKWFSFKKEKDL